MSGDQATNAVTEEDDPVFAVTVGDLRQRLTVPEIERREWVTDPLGGAPERPFGHLHAAWQAFLKPLHPDDELWSFEARWTNRWEQTELWAGYVVVRQGVPGAHFHTLARTLEEEDTQAAGPA